MNLPRTVEDVDGGALPDRVEKLLASGYRLALVAAHHDNPDHPLSAALRVVYLFLASRPEPQVELHLHLDATKPVIPSLAGRSFPAGRF